MLPRYVLYPLALVGAIVAIYYTPEATKAARHAFSGVRKRMR